MKIKQLSIIALMGLVFAACKKDQHAEPKKQGIETIEITGVTYPKDSTLNIFEKNSGLSRDRFVFDQESEKFFVADYDLYISPSDYITLKK